MSAEALCRWMTSPSEERGIWALTDDGWAFTSYDELATEARTLAAHVRRASADRAVTVLVVEDHTPAFVPLFFGCLRAGARVVPTATRSSVVGYDAYLRRVAHAARPDMVVTTTRAGDLDSVRGLGVPIVVWNDEFSARMEYHDDDRSGVSAGELLQFTSGSTGAPRGTLITGSALAANVAMLQAWLRWQPNDTVASWLPLHHDMGLVGGCVAAVCAQSSLWAMRPRQYLLEPGRWLEALSRGATLTAAPPFAYAHVARRAVGWPGLDLSTVRAAIVGAEMITAAPLLEFTEGFEGSGFRSKAFCPAYGLAEATLAVTGVPPEVRPVACVEWEDVRCQQWASAPLADLSELRRSPARATAILSSGGPLPDVSVAVESGSGARLPRGAVGEITVRTASRAVHYVASDGSTTPIPSKADALLTGDIGVSVEDELFVLGRRADAMKLRGTLVLAEQVEVALAVELGIEPRQCAVSFVPTRSGYSATVTLEEAPDTAAPEARRFLKRLTHKEIDVDVRLVDAGSIPRTSSGKPKRHALSRQPSVGEG